MLNYAESLSIVIDFDQHYWKKFGLTLEELRKAKVIIK